MQRVQGVDAAFLAAETPEWHFHVSALQIVDPSGAEDFGFEAFHQLCERRIHRVPQFRWKLFEAPLRVGWSYFADDPDFDLVNHLRHVVLPAPGDRVTLATMVGRLLSNKIDRSRPLWEMWFIEGLENERAAVFTKVHHSIIDGASGAEIATLLFDLSPDAEPDPEPPPYEPEPQPSWAGIVARNALGTMATPVRLAQYGRQLIEQGVAAVPAAFGGSRPAMPFQAPETPFNGQLTPHRGFASAVLALETVKRIKSTADVKVNDVVLAVCAGALRSYLQDRGELPERSLVAQIPVSSRTDASKHLVGTQVGSMFESLSTDVVDPADRLLAIRDGSVAAKKLYAAMSAHRSLGISDAVPPSMFSAAARAWSLAHLDARTPPIYNVIVSNVAGPPIDFYVCGARIEHMYPLGPLLYGGGLNITFFSNGPTIDVGLMTCPELLPDPWALADRFEPALDELLQAVTGATP
jgi:diacylglycerol O-acyltransferase / wax synthase